MSQKGTRKSQNATVAIEEKEKVENPVKEMKKKIAANAEKEKQTTDNKADKDKPTEKNDKSEPADKQKPTQTDKHTDKSEKQDNKVAEKKAEKQENKVAEKKTEKPDSKIAEKKAEKQDNKVAEKKPEKADKGGDKKADKSSEKKAELAEKDESNKDKNKEKPTKPHNGTTSTTTTANGEGANGTTRSGSEDSLAEDSFPELAYEDSDTDAEDAPSRSCTRRSQVKVTKTPETPRPASERESDDSKESKLLKLKEDTVPSDRKLRSADSPKPEAKKPEKKAQESPKKPESGQDEEKKAPTKKDLEGETEKEQPKDRKPDDKLDKMEVEVVIEIESTEGPASRTRARVSPYARHERTRTSVTAEYTGNNSTMETSLDTTESSYREEASLDDSYLRGLRGIRGRNSYKPLRDLKLTHTHADRPRIPAQTSFGRPTGAVIGRKRKPSPEGDTDGTQGTQGTHGTHTTHGTHVEMAQEATDDIFATHGKRMKLLDRLSMSMPFRNSTRRNAEIVGINTDLPLTAPVASAQFDSFDPERIKPATPLAGPVATPLKAPSNDRNASRCDIM